MTEAMFPSQDQEFDNALTCVLQGLSCVEKSSEALEFLYDFLHTRFGLSAMALEVAAGTATRLHTFGDVAHLTRLAALDDPSSVPGVSVFPLNNLYAPPGEITYVFPIESATPKSLLTFATVQFTQILAQETLIRRAEEAEDKARQRITELSTIYEIGQAIDQIEPERVLQLITDRTVQLMEAQACSLMLVDTDSDTLRVVACHGLPDEALDKEQRLGEGIAGRVAQTEQPALIVGEEQAPLFEGVVLRPEISSSMLVPLKNREGAVLGVLSIRRCLPAPHFTDDDLKLFTVFATQAALTITNVRLYSDLRRRVEELDKISTLSRSLISTINIDELLSRAADDVCQVVGFERCCIYMRDGGRSPYVLRAKRGYADAIGNKPFRDGEGALGAATRDRAPLLFDARLPVPEESGRDRAYLQRKGLARSLGTDAFVAFPILASQNRCLGIIVADNKTRRAAISSEQVSLLSAFANQAGIAIENGLRYEETQNKNQQLKRLNNYTDNVLRSIESGLISTDTSGVVVQMNRAAEEALGRRSGQGRGQLLSDVFSVWRLQESECHALLDMVRCVADSGQPIHEPKFLLHPGERRQMWLNLTLSPLLDHNEERAGVVLVFDDVTQEIQLEMELDRMRRLADIGQLAARMAHEVRNGLSPIKGAAQMLQSDLEAQSASTEWTGIIITEVDNLNNLTREMLNFARQAPLNIQPLNITDFLTNAIQSLANLLIEHRIIVQWEVAADLPEIMADSAQLSQVIRNLVMNAVQAMSDGGELRVHAEFDDQTRNILMSLRDSGIGIPEDERARIFLPFVTTKTIGTGLGLPIVQRILEQHGGSIRVDSVEGAWTCFYIILPLQPPGEQTSYAVGPLGPNVPERLPDH